MKTRIISILIVFFSFASCFSQENSFVKFNYQTQPTKDIDINQFGLTMGFDLLKNDKSSFLNSISYGNTKFKYEDAIPFSEKLEQFNTVEYHLRYNYRISELWEIEAKINPSANFETNFGISDVSLFGSLGITRKISSNTKLAVGVFRDKVFGKPQILPSLLFLHQFKNNIELGLGFPKSKISYSNNERNLFSIQNNFDGYFYNIDQKIQVINSEANRISFAQMSTTFQFDRKFDDNFTLTLKGGYDFNRKYKLSDSEANSKYDFEISNSPTLNFGIKYQL
jgi:hypothetical protein